MRTLYIDGGALDAEIDQFCTLLGVTEIPFDYQRFINQFGPDRTYYYDAWPEQNPEGKSLKDDAGSQTKQKLFSTLNKLPNVHVRTGTTRWSRGHRRKQKAVDVLLAVDVVSHALSGVTDFATIFVSDLDFYPVFDALLHSRVQTRLIFRSKSTSDDLIEVADHAVRFTRTQLLNCCNEEFAVKYRCTDSNTSGPMEAVERQKAVIGQIRNQEIAVWQNDDGSYTCWNINIRTRSLVKEIAIERFVTGPFEKVEFSDGTVFP